MFGHNPPESCSRLRSPLIFLYVFASLRGAHCSEPVEAPRPPFTESPLRLDLPAGTLHGTLALPPGPGPFPAVLLIAGSGPTDRNGNQPRSLLINDSLKQLAHGLAACGIAVARYDRRGVGESAAVQKTEHDVTIDLFAEDAAAWVRLLRADPRFFSVTIAGHSEGALTGLLAARREKVDAFVSLAGPGRNFADVLREQLSNKLTAAARDRALKVIDDLAAGGTVQDPPPELAALFRPSVQPFLIALFKYDPAEELAAFDGPSLIVQGTPDLQITVADAERLAAANPKVTLKVFDGFNHLLKPATNQLEQTAAYHLPVPAVSRDVIETVADFLMTADRSRR